jgi:hypothetical protein
MAGRNRRPHLSIPIRLAAAGLFAIAILGATVAPVLAGNFPPKDSRYHTYAEMAAEIHAVAAAHPSIVQVFSIGKSYQGRELWAAKISDNVATDEDEPEVLFDALHHAREHMTGRAGALPAPPPRRQLRQGHDDHEPREHPRGLHRVHAQPDGAEYDLTCGGAHAPYCAWRKNRQPNCSGCQVGTDLNRNYDYRWDCCGGSSGSTFVRDVPRPEGLLRAGDPGDARLRQQPGEERDPADPGPHHVPHERPADPLAVRPHEDRHPADMSIDDHTAFVTMGKAMAQLNGYKAEQSSDLYITDGDQIDWLYGRHRIFSYTWELYPPETSTVWGDHYPPDESIAPQTARNRGALLYFLDIAGCPYRSIGKEQTDCGPFRDDFEIDRGWQYNPYGTDTAVKGTWAPRAPSRPRSAASGSSWARRTPASSRW